MEKNQTMYRFHESVFEINLGYLEENLNYLKSKLGRETKIIAVVKAYAYGHGDLEITKKLEALNIYAFWVADFEEGVILRKSGITKPIIVANPSPRSASQIIKYNLDVVVYSFRLLKLFGKLKKQVNIHLKFNSGMNRFGFSELDIVKLQKELGGYKDLTIVSICSHLSSSRNDKKDHITKKALKSFNNIISNFSKQNQTEHLTHILNTSGVLRFNNHQYDAVRIGIGLFGVHKDKNLIQIGRLTSTISQIRMLRKGDAIGYEGSFICERKMKIGVIPFGYADGLDRRLGNLNGSLFLNGKFCNIVGDISMDSCVIDLSRTNAVEGDRVEIFGTNNSIYSICKKINSIPYEFLSKINRRIKRIYN
jgi:alanine racemase